MTAPDLLEELQAAMERYDADPLMGSTTPVIDAARALLAASSTGERPDDEDLIAARRIDLFTVVEQNKPHPNQSTWGNTIRLLAIRCAAAESSPTPPPEPAGTPSDDGRVSVSADVWRRSLDTYLRWVNDEASDEDVIDAFGRVVQAAPTYVVTPAAPSGTTGATAGGRIVCSVCGGPKGAAIHDDEAAAEWGAEAHEFIPSIQVTCAHGVAGGFTCYDCGVRGEAPTPPGPPIAPPASGATGGGES